MNKEIIILCPYPPETAGSQRFRFEQYLSFFNQVAEIKQLSFWDKKTSALLYKKGHFLRKTFGLIFNVCKRWIQLFKISNARIVFIHRETMPIGSGFYEYFIAKILNKKIIYDFDDAIWNPNVAKENRYVAWVKNPNKTQKLIKLATVVIAGNRYLADFAKKFNSTVEIIPTTIDANYHKKPENKVISDTICIGWTGSKTTVPHFEILNKVLKEIKEKYKGKVCFKLIGDENYHNSDLDIQGVAWSLKEEIKSLSEIDIGIMPLPDNDWTKGKCGFKGLQYMALEIPAVLSPVGVNNSIIQDGTNGFLANTETEWIEKLSALIESKELREKLGKAGRKTIEEKYSVEANKEKYLQIFRKLTAE